MIHHGFTYSDLCHMSISEIIFWLKELSQIYEEQEERWKASTK